MMKGFRFKAQGWETYFFNTEKAIQIQMDLGSDIAMAFDQCPPYSASE